MATTATTIPETDEQTAADALARAVPDDLRAAIAKTAAELDALQPEARRLAARMALLFTQLDQARHRVYAGLDVDSTDPDAAPLCDWLCDQVNGAAGVWAMIDAAEAIRTALGASAVSAEPPRPARSASKTEWVAYATAMGEDPEDAAALTRAELADRYGA